jgi:N utilization substance protein B
MDKQEISSPPAKIISDWEDGDDSKIDSRHLERMALVQALFVDEFPHQNWESFEVNFNHQILNEIRANKNDYDSQIQAIATERPINELAKTDLAILRLILHESKTKDTPIKVLIDEGVELAKDFGGEHSYAFVNAVLEKLLLKSQTQGEKQNE